MLHDFTLQAPVLIQSWACAVLPASQKTGFRGYTLEVILNLLLNRQLSIQEYIKQANANKVGGVSVIDRKVRTKKGAHDAELAKPTILHLARSCRNCWSSWTARGSCSSTLWRARSRQKTRLMDPPPSVHVWKVGYGLTHTWTCMHGRRSHATTAWRLLR